MMTSGFWTAHGVAVGGPDIGVVMTLQMQHEGIAGGAAPLRAPDAPEVRTLTIGRRTIPVVGPRLRDPRLHLALIIVSVLVVGTTLLGFRLSIPQIVIPVIVCAAVEVVHRLVTTGALAWPASGMQTATSTVLIVRIVGVEHGDWMSFDGVHWMVGIAVCGLFSKYFIRTASGHVFNPSNVALVVAFLVLGAERIEPLDYWWGALDWRLALAYGTIVVGGITLCCRLDLLPMAISFWVTLAIGVGVLAALGHSMTTRWSFAPVADWHLWRTIVLSPETMIFFFFMVTDPRTTPSGRRNRVLFGVLVGAMSTLLLAPWPTEFGSKVGLLAGLTVGSLLRHPLERFSGSWGERRNGADPWRIGARPMMALAGVGAVLLFGASVAMAGAPNRASADAGDVPDGVTAALGASMTAGVELDGGVPNIAIAPDVAGLSPELATQDGAREVVDALMFNLAVEAEAVALGDPSLLEAVDHGARLVDIAAEVESAGGRQIRSVYRVDTLELGVVFPGGLQSGPNAGLRLAGQVSETTVGPDGSPGEPTERPIDVTYTLRRATGGAWLTTGTVPD